MDRTLVFIVASLTVVSKKRLTAIPFTILTGLNLLGNVGFLAWGLAHGVNVHKVFLALLITVAGLAVNALSFAMVILSRGVRTI